MKALTWHDIYDIVLSLEDLYPDEDVYHISFPDLWKKIIHLPDFSSDPNECSEKILEAIQAAWLEERED